MQRSTFGVSSALLTCLVLLAPARGGIVNLTSQDRSVDVRFTDGTPQQSQMASDFEPFNAQVGFPKENLIADQHSTLSLTPDGGVFSALSDVRGSSPTAIFGSTFHVGFDVTRAVDYSFAYGFGASGSGNDIIPTALFIGPFGTRDISRGIDETGVLQPGSYQIQVDDVGGINVTYSVNFAAVPLPSAFWATMLISPAPILIWLWRRFPLQQLNP